MKEIKQTRTIEEVTGYEAFDGTIFKDKAECEKYENSAEAVIKNRFASHIVKGNLNDLSVVDPYGTSLLYDCDENHYVLYDLADEDAVKDIEMFGTLRNEWTLDKAKLDKYKGEVVLVGIWLGESRCCVFGTEAELKAEYDKYFTDMFRLEDVAVN